MPNPNPIPIPAFAFAFAFAFAPPPPLQEQAKDRPHRDQPRLSGSEGRLPGQVEDCRRLEAGLGGCGRVGGEADGGREGPGRGRVVEEGGVGTRHMGVGVGVGVGLGWAGLGWCGDAVGDAVGDADAADAAADAAATAPSGLIRRASSRGRGHGVRRGGRGTEDGGRSCLRRERR